MGTEKNISVIAVVYNEAHRIEYFLRSFQWSDDLIIIDKSSTDNTRDIVLKYTQNLIIVPYSDTGDEAHYGVEIAKNEWVMTLTASDTIHPALVAELLKLINKDGFEYDVISLPYALYVFGIRNPKRSPWHSTRKSILMKKDALKLSTEVHREYSTSSDRIYRMDYSDKKNLYHLTHENMGSFFERHNRYTRLEAELSFNERDALRASLKELFKSIKFVLFKKKSFLLGWDGVALGLAYISYFIMKYLYVWEKFRGKGPAEYANIRKEMLGMWNDCSNHK
jgi:glycosyltransferase involved in cell wall biosynthesis